MARLLLVDNDPFMQRTLQKLFVDEGYYCAMAVDAEEARRLMPETKVSITVNGTPHTISVSPVKRLLDILREDLSLTGTKEGCGEGECGACSIILDGQLVNSCLVPALQADGARITTIEGIATPEKLHRMQLAFLACAGTRKLAVRR